MRKLIILARVKERGNTCGYIIQQDGIRSFINKENMPYNEVQNAIRLANGEWRAKQGESIKNIERSRLGLFINNRYNAIVGKPDLLFNYTFAKLSCTQKNIYEQCKKAGIHQVVMYDKHNDNIKITMKDLSALTAYTGVEFSLFERPDKYIVVMGTKTGIALSNKITALISNGKYKWIGHTHPGHDVICLTPSDSDYYVLNKLNQKRSVIYNSVCMYYIFGEEESI